MNKDIEIMSVSQYALLAGIHSYKLPELKDKTVVVINRKGNKVKFAFKLVTIPESLDQVCPVCEGKGKVQVNL